MKKVFFVYVFCLCCFIAQSQTRRKKAEVEDSIRKKTFAKADYSWFLQSGKEKYNKLEFVQAEKEYLLALELLQKDTLSKNKQSVKYTNDEMILLKSLREVNKSLKDYNDVDLYNDMIKNHESKITKNKTSINREDMFKKVSDSLRNRLFVKNDYYWYVQSGNEKFNKLQFSEAEKDYLQALQLLEYDTTPLLEKGNNYAKEKLNKKNNYSIGKIIIHKSLLEVNQGLKDVKDIEKYKTAIHKMEIEFSQATNMDLSSYFENQAKEFYKRKDFLPALKNCQLSTISCKDPVRKKSLVIFQNELEAINQFLKKDYKSAIGFCNEVLSNQPANTKVLDLRGRIYLIIGNKNNACQDWNKAYDLNYPMSKLRIDKYCH